VDVVLGVSMAPETVRLVLVEGESAGGVTVDEDTFEVAPESAAAAAADEVIAAIVGTQQSAAESGHQLQSTGVTWTDPLEADALRDALAAHKIENVMLVSAFIAAAALAQAVGSATNCARIALLFVEPTTATLAVVDSSDGSIAEVHRQALPQGGDAAMAELAAMVSGVEAMAARPESLFLVGSGPGIPDIPLIKPALEASTSLSVTAPEEPETALARGAALASANASLGAPATVAIPQAPLAGSGVGGLAYSAVSDAADDLAEGLYPEYRAGVSQQRSRKALLVAMGAMSIFVVGVVALALALALGIRPHVEQRSSLSRNVVAPASRAPAPKAPVPAVTPPSAVPAPVTQAPSQAPAPVVQQPAPSLAPPEEEPPLRPREWDRWDHRRWERGIWH
jgi:hypothetical protein